MSHPYSSTEPIAVTVWTKTCQLDGKIFVPTNGKEKRRLSHFLSTEREFITLVDVQLTDRLTNKVSPERVGFMQVNTGAIELVIPVESSEKGFLAS